ncbi:hypothetical protein GCM10009551_003330 [Nocardiopsis tropica]
MAPPIRVMAHSRPPPSQFGRAVLDDLLTRTAVGSTRPSTQEVRPPCDPGDDELDEDEEGNFGFSGRASVVVVLATWQAVEQQC